MTGPDVERIEQVLDGARLVRVDEVTRLMAVWSGGLTINIYATDTFGETTCATISDEVGEPLDREAIDEHVDDLFERARAEIGIEEGFA